MKLINFKFMTNSCVWNTSVTSRGTNHELPEDEHESVETCRSVMICELTVIVPLLVTVQNKKNKKNKYNF